MVKQCESFFLLLRIYPIYPDYDRERRRLGALSELQGKTQWAQRSTPAGAAGPALRSHVSRFLIPEIDFLSNVNEPGALLFLGRLERPASATIPHGTGGVLRGQVELDDEVNTLARMHPSIGRCPCDGPGLIKRLRSLQLQLGASPGGLVGSGLCTA